MPLIDINLLQREQSTVSRLAQATTIVGVVSGSVVVLLLLVVVFLYTTIAIRSGQKDGLIQEQTELTKQAESISEFDQPFYPEMTLGEQAAAYQEQIDGVKKLVDNHKYFTLYLSEIAVNTPTSVIYQSFGSDSADQLVVTGTAAAYGDVSKLAKRLGGLSFAKSASIQDARLNRGSTGLPVQFTLVIELKSAAELDKLPGPDQPFGSSGGASPRPLPSVAPSPGGASGSSNTLPLGGE
ncbi:MAG TPA: hypothetical protein VIF43_03805 [Patescibacteria group bacterium]|jgi:Tfp pilus assembly protein PilN